MIANLLRMQVGYNIGTALAGSTLDRNAILLPLLILAAGIWPARSGGMLPFLALLARALTNLAKGAMMSNSQMWATQMDTALLIAIAGCMRRRPAFLAGPLRCSEERAIIGECARTIR